MELLIPGLLAAAFGLPPAVLLAMAALRLLRDRRAGSRLWPRWGPAGVLAVMAVTALIGRAAMDWVRQLSDSMPLGLQPVWLDFLPLYVFEIGALTALLVGWLLDDAQRRHRHLHELTALEKRHLSGREQDFVTIIDTIPEAVLITATASGVVVGANAFARHWLGREEQMSEGTPLAEWLAPPDRENVPGLLARLSDTRAGSESPAVAFFAHADGRRIEAEVVGTAVLYLGRPSVVLLARDLSAVEQARRAAEVSSRAKNQILANVSHEIRTPLNGILGLTELSLDRPLEQDLKEDLETIQRCARDLLSIVDDVLDFSRFEASQLDLNKTIFDPRELVEELVAGIAPRAHGKGLTLIDIPRRDLPRSVEGDAVRLRQMLINLIGNAVKFSPSGKIVLRVQPDGPPGDGKQILLFSVEDDGPGIAKKDQDAIFDAFHAEGREFGAETQGIGVGLSLTRQLARAMGGTIEVDSALGSGSTFRLRIPFPLAAPASAASSRLPFPGRQVLVVHPSLEARTSLSEKLLYLGIRSRCVGSLMDAVAQTTKPGADRAGFGAILIDAQLLSSPSMEPLVEKVRHSPAGELPLFPLTSRPQCVAPEGCREKLVFPVASGRLHQVLERLWSSGEDAIQAAPKEDKVPSAPGNESILVVEDNPVNTRLFVRHLEQAGYRVSQAGNGQQALEMLAAEEIDLVLMDVQMPVMDGLEATRRLRRDPRFRDLPIVALTAHAQAGDRDLCLAAGMTGYISKPVRRKELVQIVARFLRAKAPAGVRS